ncbi:Protein of unknown function [Cotesia congregata]|uniref:Uncharacterized protein n=1 Tax=Cotesia congregata TaxID=51543 RepID=A0A8J2E418_COTCN|nr:Protein of unknown function [Cotesia congregata]
MTCGNSFKNPEEISPVLCMSSQKIISTRELEKISGKVCSTAETILHNCTSHLYPASDKIYTVTVVLYFCREVISAALKLGYFFYADADIVSLI